MIADLFRDLRHAARMLAKKPLFALTAVLTLALGIGANTAIFSVVNAVLLRALPYRSADRLISLDALGASGDRDGFSLREAQVFQSRTRTLEALTLATTQSVNLTGGERPERVRGAFVSANFFDVFAVAPIFGRTFAEGEDRPGGARFAVVNEKLWRARSNLDERVGSRTLTLNGEPYAVIGVVPESFKQPFDPEVEVWLLVTNHPNADARFVSALGYLREGIGLPAARAEVAAIASQLARDLPQENAGRGATVEFVREFMVARSRPMLWSLFAAVSAILLIACANMANLLLARGLVRQREMAVRAALGATRRRLVRQLLTETTLLGLAGGAAGLLLAHWGLSALLRLQQSFVFAADAALDTSVLLFTSAVSLLTSWLFGLAPALQLSRPELQASLREGARGSGDAASWNRLRGAFVVAQVALSFLLLVGAGLLIRSFDNLLGVDVGFKPEGLLTLEYRLPRSKYPEPRAQWEVHRQVVERIREVPGVQSVSLVEGLPFSGNGLRTALLFPDRERPPAGKEPEVLFDAVTPNYFETLGIPLFAGRRFGDEDRLDSPMVVIVNQTLARRFWPDQVALGKQIQLLSDGTRASVVGIAGDAKQFQLDEEPKPHAYVSFAQRPGLFATVAVRTALEPMALSEPVRQALWKADREQPMWKVRTLESLLNGNIADRKFLATLIGVFAALALLLTLIGLYGVISYLVDQRTREIGIRMALGAQVGDIVRMILKRGVILVALGLALGLAAAWGMTGLMAPLLYRVSATDPSIFAAVALSLVPVALLACYLPARRATKLDPLVVLRQE
jgi:putative ABC transport system permease protein